MSCMKQHLPKVALDESSGVDLDIENENSENSSSSLSDAETVVGIASFHGLSVSADLNLSERDMASSVDREACSVTGSPHKSQGQGQHFEPMDKAVSQTVKLNPKIELSRPVLLKLLSYMEAEMQARDVVIATLKTERIKNLMHYGRASLNDPFLALQRDNIGGQNTCAGVSENQLRQIEETQLHQLENLIAQQRKAHQRMRQILREAEKRHAWTVDELEKERKNHENDSAQGDDINFHAEKDQTRLKQDLEQERSCKRKAETDLKRMEDSIDDERNRHKQIIIMLVEERKRLAIQYVEERKRAEDLAQILSEEKGRIDSMAEGLEEESKKSLQMEAELEKQLADFDTERHQLRNQIAKKDERLSEMDLLVDKLHKEVEHYKKQLQEAHNVAMFQQTLSVSPPRIGLGTNTVIKNSSVKPPQLPAKPPSLSGTLPSTPRLQSSSAHSNVAKAVQLTATVNSVPVAGPTTGIARGIQSGTNIRPSVYSSSASESRSITTTPKTSYGDGEGSWIVGNILDCDTVTTSSQIGSERSLVRLTGSDSGRGQSVQVSPRVNVSASSGTKVITTSHGGKVTFHVTANATSSPGVSPIINNGHGSKKPAPPSRGQAGGSTSSAVNVSKPIGAPPIPPNKPVVPPKKDLTRSISAVGDSPISVEVKQPKGGTQTVKFGITISKGGSSSTQQSGIILPDSGSIGGGHSPAGGISPGSVVGDALRRESAKVGDAETSDPISSEILEPPVDATATGVPTKMHGCVDSLLSPELESFHQLLVSMAGSPVLVENPFREPSIDSHSINISTPSVSTNTNSDEPSSLCREIAGKDVNEPVRDCNSLYDGSSLPGDKTPACVMSSKEKESIISNYLLSPSQTGSDYCLSSFSSANAGCCMFNPSTSSLSSSNSRPTKEVVCQDKHFSFVGSKVVDVDSINSSTSSLSSSPSSSILRELTPGLPLLSTTCCISTGDEDPNSASTQESKSHSLGLSCSSCVATREGEDVFDTKDNLIKINDAAFKRTNDDLTCTEISSMLHKIKCPNENPPLSSAAMNPTTAAHVTMNVIPKIEKTIILSTPVSSKLKGVALPSLHTLTPYPRIATSSSSPKLIRSFSTPTTFSSSTSSLLHKTSLSLSPSLPLHSSVQSSISFSSPPPISISLNDEVIPLNTISSNKSFMPQKLELNLPPMESPPDPPMEDYPSPPHSPLDVGTPLTEDGMTALHLAAQGNNYQSISTLITCGAKVTSEDEYGRTPLFLSLLYHCHQSARILLLYPQPLDHVTKDGSTYLHAAANSKSYESLEIFVKFLVRSNHYSMLHNLWLQMNDHKVMPISLVVDSFTLREILYESGLDLRLIALQKPELLEVSDAALYFFKENSEPNVKKFGLKFRLEDSAAIEPSLATDLKAQRPCFESYYGFVSIGEDMNWLTLVEQILEKTIRHFEDIDISESAATFDVHCEQMALGLDTSSIVKIDLGNWTWHRDGCEPPIESPFVYLGLSKEIFIYMYPLPLFSYIYLIPYVMLKNCIRKLERSRCLVVYGSKYSGKSSLVKCLAALWNFNTLTNSGKCDHLRKINLENFLDTSEPICPCLKTIENEDGSLTHANGLFCHCQTIVDDKRLCLCDRLFQAIQSTYSEGSILILHKIPRMLWLPISKTVERHLRRSTVQNHCTGANDVRKHGCVISTVDSFRRPVGPYDADVMWVHLRHDKEPFSNLLRRSLNLKMSFYLCGMEPNLGAISPSIYESVLWMISSFDRLNQVLMGLGLSNAIQGPTLFLSIISQAKNGREIVRFAHHIWNDFSIVIRKELQLMWNTAEKTDVGSIVVNDLFHKDSNWLKNLESSSTDNEEDPKECVTWEHLLKMALKIILRRSFLTNLPCHLCPKFVKSGFKLSVYEVKDENYIPISSSDEIKGLKRVCGLGESSSKDVLMGTSVNPPWRPSPPPRPKELQLRSFSPRNTKRNIFSFKTSTVGASKSSTVCKSVELGEDDGISPISPTLEEKSLQHKSRNYS